VRTWKLNNLQTEEIKTNKPKIATLWTQKESSYQICCFTMTQNTSYQE
jgi:hypothetical protein